MPTLTSCVCGVVFVVFVLPPLLLLFMYSARVIAWFLLDIPRDETSVEAFFLDDALGLIVGGLLLFLVALIIVWLISCLLTMISDCLYYTFVWPITWPCRRFKQHREDKKTNVKFRQYARILLDEAKKDLNSNTVLDEI